MGEHFEFRSDRARAELNPFVERIQEFRPWTVLAEEAPDFRGSWRQQMGLAQDAELVLEIGPGNGFFFAEICGRYDGDRRCQRCCGGGGGGVRSGHSPHCARRSDAGPRSGRRVNARVSRCDRRALGCADRSACTTPFAHVDDGEPPR